MGIMWREIPTCPESSQRKALSPRKGSMRDMMGMMMMMKGFFGKGDISSSVQKGCVRCPRNFNYNPASILAILSRFQGVVS